MRLAALALGLLVGLGVVAPAAAGEAPRKPRPDSESQRRERLDDDVATFENAVGGSHGMTPEQIHEFMREARRDPVSRNRFMGVSTLQNPNDA